MKKIVKIAMVLILLTITMIIHITSYAATDYTYTYKGDVFSKDWDSTGIDMYHANPSEDGASTKIKVRSRKNGADYDITLNASGFVGKELSALSLGKNNGVFCMQSPETWYNMQDIYSAQWMDMKNSRYAYVLSVPKHIAWTYYPDSDEWFVDSHDMSPSQYAYWKLLGQPIPSTLRGNKVRQYGEVLYNQAIKYQEYVNNFSALDVLENPDTYTNYQKIGPFKISFTVGTFKSQTYILENNTGEKTVVIPGYVKPVIKTYNGSTEVKNTIIDSSGNTISDITTLNKGQAFYLKCNSEIDKIQFIETRTLSRVQGIKLDTSHQDVFLAYYGKVWNKEYPTELTISPNKPETTKFTLYKKGKTLDNAVNNARIRVALGTAIKSLKINDITISEDWIKAIRRANVNRVYQIYSGNKYDYCYTFEDEFEPPGDGTYMWREDDGYIRISTVTKSGGRIILNNIVWDTSTGKKELRFREDVAPKGYTKNSDSIYLEYKDGKWKKIGNGTNNWSYTDGKDYATLYNEIEPITNFQINKKEMSTDNYIPGTEFSLYFNRIAKINLGTQNGKTYSTIDVKTVMKDRTVEGGTRETVLYYKLKTDGTVGTKSYKLAELEEMEDDSSIYIAQNENDSNTLHVYKLITDSNGKIKIPKIVSDKEGLEKNGIMVSIYETKAIGKYQKLPGNIYTKYIFNSDKNEWLLVERTADRTSVDSKYWNIEDNNKEVTVYNEYKPITNLKIYKKDIIEKEALNDVVFEVYFNIVSQIQFGEMDKAEKISEIFKNLGKAGTGGNYYKIDPKTGIIASGTKGVTREKAIEDIKANGTIYVSNVPKNGQANIKILGLKTNSNGEITISKIVPVVGKERNGVVVTVIEAIASEFYKVNDGSIYMLCKMNHETNKWYLEKRSGYTSIDQKYWEIKANSVTVTVYDEPELIDLSGQVWIDGQKGEKAVTAADGIKNDNKYLKGIKVRLHSAKDDSKVAETTTDKDGKYSFKDIRKTAEGYKIKFEYNGILYDDVGIKGDSKAGELDTERNSLNNRFKTIDVNGSNDKTTIDYGEYNKKTKTSKFQSTLEGTKPANTAINAYTNVYKETTENIDCGLLEKSFDLAIGTDVKEAKIKINGHSTTYKYAQIMNGELEDLTLDELLQNKAASSSQPVYNLELYRSDYNYRITDYKTDIDGNKAPDTDTNGIADYDDLSNLQIVMKYSVILKNQTTHIGTVEQFIYYYDKEVFIPFNETANRELENGDKINGYEVESIDKENGKIIFKNANAVANELKSPNYRKEIELVFTVKQDTDGKVMLKDDIRNIAEITKYSSYEGGLIDKDSQPGNANITLDKITGKYKIGKDEDDTHLAPGINIGIIIGDRREITGIVFDDTKSVNGKFENNNNAVNDVVVQLIEIKNIAGKPCEYIWQETRSGNEKLRIASKENGNPYEYPEANKDIEKGSYRFTDFIPGNYIVRFIYGDGRTWDVNPNVQKYNGQDYQSTIDENNYNKQWYDASAYQTNSSVATDNESRRLETMAYTVEVNGELGTAIKTINTDFAKLTQEEKKLMSDYYSQILELADENEEENKILEKAYKTAYKTETVVLPDANDTSKIEDYYKIVKNYALQKTWMSAETAKIYVPIDANKFNNVNFGLRLRPETKITVEKHITALKITPTGVGTGAAIDVVVDIQDILDGKINKNTKQGDASNLAIIPSTRTERGFWKVETDVEELAQGAKLNVQYTYVIRNESEDYYLSKYLLEKYEENKDNLGKYKKILLNKATEVKNAGNETKGSFLGQYYYTGKAGGNEGKNLAKVDKLEEALNNKLYFNELKENASFKKANTDPVDKKYYNIEGKMKELKIETIVETNSPTECLPIGEEEKNRTLDLETTISVLTNGEVGATIPSYITEIETYSNAAGRINKNSAIPGNLAYIHNDDKRATLDSYVQKDDNGDYSDRISLEKQEGYIKMNECDEFWGETIIISKPTGEDKNQTPMIITIAISSIAAIGVGIILIKKYVLKK